MKRFPLPTLLKGEYQYPELRADIGDLLDIREVQHGVLTTSVGLVRLLRGAPGTGVIEVDDTRVERIRISRSYDTDQARRRARAEELHRQQRLEPPVNQPPDPYIAVVLTPLEGSELTLYWNGDGTYDGWSVERGHESQGSQGHDDA